MTFNLEFTKGMKTAEEDITSGNLSLKTKWNKIKR
jgi:hypothetical protein